MSMAGESNISTGSPNGGGWLLVSQKYTILPAGLVTVNNVKINRESSALPSQTGVLLYSITEAKALPLDALK